MSFFKSELFWCLSAILLLTFGSPGLAQIPVSETPEPTPSPIDIHFATLSGIRYIQDDRFLSGEDLQKIIFPLDDPEATRLLKRSQSSGILGTIGLILGLGTMTGGVIVATNNTADAGGTGTGLGIALSGVCLTGAAALFSSEGKTTEFNAVQRYNHLAWGDEKSKSTTGAGQTQIKIQPIDVRLSTFDGFGYSVQGKELTRFEDIRERIDSINDFEAARLIKKSESSDLISKILLGLGFGGEIATIAANSGLNNGGDRAGLWFPMVGALLLAEAGSFFRAEANTTKFNAIKRYNRFARGEEEVLPQPQDDKMFLNVIPTVDPGSQK